MSSLPNPNKLKNLSKKFGHIACGDILVAGVINQKAINQNAQQILAVVAVQATNIIEAQLGFSTNKDDDQIIAL
ncbi:hypothetical protein F8154_09365 [Alkaliphilus pronyensis]|uniref:Uncharacterized protein n=1 Tax=Alkaliphilus pronyensis TaxID=1482732 RepID=A0A6I0F7F8_9FIRM|nr:hypothetical protein [Alkaliphilus pronyensis]KAB3534136.1 hypothetical protein F8154_09365 [Alkaliphilus pronyensis]